MMMASPFECKPLSGDIVVDQSPYSPTTSSSIHTNQETQQSTSTPSAAPAHPKRASSTTSKKKRPLLGMLVQKEPSKVALEQFTASIEAQRGLTSGKAVPHVSSQRMPAFVPKVNSKWNGVPSATVEQGKVRTKTNRISSIILSWTKPRAIATDNVPNISRTGSIAHSSSSQGSQCLPNFDDISTSRPSSNDSTSSAASQAQHKTVTSMSDSAEILSEVTKARNSYAESIPRRNTLINTPSRSQSFAQHSILSDTISEEPALDNPTPASNVSQVSPVHVRSHSNTATDAVKSGDVFALSFHLANEVSSVWQPTDTNFNMKIAPETTSISQHATNISSRSSRSRRSSNAKRRPSREPGMPARSDTAPWEKFENLPPKTEPTANRRPKKLGPFG